EGKVTSPDDSGSSRPGPPASPGNDDTAQQHDRDESFAHYIGFALPSLQSIVCSTVTAESTTKAAATGT
ncbi:hypothetical protein BaRGS_00015360, partial [Batillaria attramentaria]